MVYLLTSVQDQVVDYKVTLQRITSIEAVDNIINVDHTVSFKDLDLC